MAILEKFEAIRFSQFDGDEKTTDFRKKHWWWFRIGKTLPGKQPLLFISINFALKTSNPVA